MNLIKQNLQRVHKRIINAAMYCGRNPSEITLLAASKNQPINIIKKTILEGQKIFGENYVQEGVNKIIHLTEYFDLQWHFIGPLQSNKSRLVAENFSWCHSIDRIHIAQRLNNQRPKKLQPLNVLIQINISKEYSKFGILLQDLPNLAQQVSSLPNLCLRGITAIPAKEENYQKQIIICKKMVDVFHSLQKVYPNVDTLSLGMSNDMEAAIIAGSTLIRIGTAIFGSRNDVHNLY